MRLLDALGVGALIFIIGPKLPSVGLWGVGCGRGAALHPALEAVGGRAACA
jgi:hypothetical protein